MPITTTDLGPMGRGSNMFRCGIVHSSGRVFIGTYGPPPGIIWRYDPDAGELTKIVVPLATEIGRFFKADKPAKADPQKKAAPRGSTGAAS